MADSFTQVFIHLIFAVQHRESLIRDDFRDDLHKYISTIIQNREHKLLAINSVEDHIHILIGFDLKDNIPDLVRVVKRDSTIFINNKKFNKNRFNWQTGYGAFSYSKGQVNNVVKYINNQKEHHKKRLFKEEFLEILNKLNIEFQEKYLFDFNLKAKD